MGIDHNLNPDPIELARVLSAPTNRAREDLIRKGTSTTRGPPSTHKFDLTSTPGDDSVSHQHALFGDSLNDEQRGYDLSIRGHIRQPVRRSGCEKART